MNIIKDILILPGLVSLREVCYCNKVSFIFLKKTSLGTHYVHVSYPIGCTALEMWLKSGGIMIFGTFPNAKRMQ